MAYKVKEVFYSLQGEGAHAGRPAIFCRFTGCNLWNGLEKDRETADCQFCDTDFVGTDGQRGGRYSALELAALMHALWPKDSSVVPFCVLTGGEPAMQFDDALRQALKVFGFEIAIETNGTMLLKAQADWVCVSPKGVNALQLRQGNELKLVWPQPMHPVDPADYVGMSFDYYFLQPIDGLASDYTRACLEYCLSHPQWRLGLQLHKQLGID